MLINLVINDETGDFVDAFSIVAVVSTETATGVTTVPGSLIYLSGQDDVFVSPLTPKEVQRRMGDACKEESLKEKEAA